MTKLWDSPRLSVEGFFCECPDARGGQENGVGCMRSNSDAREQNRGPPEEGAFPKAKGIMSEVRGEVAI